jgi:hypothetical protein
MIPTKSPQVWGLDLRDIAGSVVQRKYQFLARSVQPAGTPLPIVAEDRSRPAHRAQHPRKGPVINAAMGMGPSVSTLLADSIRNEPRCHPADDRDQQEPAAAQGPRDLPLATRSGQRDSDLAREPGLGLGDA